LIRYSNWVATKSTKTAKPDSGTQLIIPFIATTTTINCIAETDTITEKKGRKFEKTVLNPIPKAFVPFKSGFKAFFALA